jgi:hypothetical protein
VEVGGFDPVYTAAGDDVDLCWKLIDRGWELGFHPAALVWHHTRPGTRAYLRQQYGYGRAEALVEARHPDRFNAVGSARWRGRIYNSFAPSLARQRIYRGVYGAASYQSVYRNRSDGAGVARHLGVPLAALLLPTGFLGLRWPLLALPALLAVVFLAAIFVAGAVRVSVPPRTRRRPSFRLGVATLEILQPLARTWGRVRYRAIARNGVGSSQKLPGPVTRLRGGVLLLPESRPRAEVACALLNALRGVGLRVSAPSGWENFDARVFGSTLVMGELITSSHPPGCVQIRVRRRPRMTVAVICAAACAMAMVEPIAAAVIGASALAEASRGVWRTGRLVRKTIERTVA